MSRSESNSRNGSPTRKILPADYVPSASLSATTAARLHDCQTWLQHKEEVGRTRFYNLPEDSNYVPSSTLLATTQARISDTKAWQEQKQRAASPSRIETNFAPPSAHLLTTTQARVNDYQRLLDQRQMKIDEAKTKVPAYVHSTFMPSAHLLQSTKARLNDHQALKALRLEASAPKVPRDLTHLPPPSEHLLMLTQSHISAINAWEKEKAEAKFADDIWWELRRPAPCSERYHSPDIPSKINVMTASCAAAVRPKFNEADAEKLRQEAMAVHSVSKIAPDSHLLSTTAAVQHQAWDDSSNSSNEFVTPTKLDLPSRSTYGNHVPSKLHMDTAATRHQRWTPPADALRSSVVVPSGPVTLSETILRPTAALLAQSRSKAVKVVENQREAKWNTHTTRGRINENPFENEPRFFLGLSSKSADHHELSVSNRIARQRKTSFTPSEVQAVVHKAVQAAQSLDTHDIMLASDRSLEVPQSQQQRARRVSTSSGSTQKLTHHSDHKEVNKAKVQPRVFQKKKQTSLRAKLEEMMMPSPIAEHHDGRLFFADLSGAVSPMSVFSCDNEQHDGEDDDRICIEVPNYAPFQQFTRKQTLFSPVVDKKLSEVASADVDEDEATVVVQTLDEEHQDLRMRDFDASLMDTTDAADIMETPAIVGHKQLLLA